LKVSRLQKKKHFFLEKVNQSSRVSYHVLTISTNPHFLGSATFIRAAFVLVTFYLVICQFAIVLSACCLLTFVVKAIVLPVLAYISSVK
jgi:hypothetical protein